MTNTRSTAQIQADITAAVARGDNDAAAAFLPEWQAANHAEKVAEAEGIKAYTAKHLQRTYRKYGTRCI